MSTQIPCSQPHGLSGSTVLGYFSLPNRWCTEKGKGVGGKGKPSLHCCVECDDCVGTRLAAFLMALGLLYANNWAFLELLQEQEELTGTLSVAGQASKTGIEVNNSLLPHGVNKAYSNCKCKPLHSFQCTCMHVYIACTLCNALEYYYARNVLSTSTMVGIK